jgi:glyoxylase-like metal-dependent hydrolase (beta-lactamase superfamily II)
LRILYYVTALAILALGAGAQNPQGVPENGAMRVSEHVYAILGFPNIAIVTGTRAVLVVDTGMGPRNGSAVMREVRKLSQTPAIYLTTTHFHPEHAFAARAFPPGTVLIRPEAQQKDIEQHGAEYLALFSSRSAQNKQLLEHVTFRKPDVLFDSEVVVDLGGVSARLFWWGPAHTPGDEMIFIPEDSVLIPGDIVQNKLVPNMPTADASLRNWLVILNRLKGLTPRYVIPDHGPLGDGSLIGQEYSFIQAVEKRALELKNGGTTVDEAADLVTKEFRSKYPDWQNTNNLANMVRRTYEEWQ